MTMNFAVIKLRDRGVRLKRDQIAAAPTFVGDLRISDWVRGNVEKRAIRQAALVEVKPQFTRDITNPLFDPVVVRMTSAWFVMRGFEIKDEGDRCVQYAQEWLVRIALLPSSSVSIERRKMPHEGN